MANKDNSSINSVRKKFQKLHDLIYTAQHEAGHVVYGLLHGVNVESVSVAEDKKSKRVGGLTWYTPLGLDKIEDLDLQRTLAETEVCFSYAGLIAEKRFLKTISGIDKFPMFLKGGSSSDLSDAALFIEKYNLAEPGRKRYNYKQKLIKKIDRELAQHWDAVTIIAHTLVNKKKISYLELKELLITQTDSREFWKQQFKIHDELCQNFDPIDEKKIKYILSR